MIGSADENAEKQWRYPSTAGGIFAQLFSKIALKRMDTAIGSPCPKLFRQD